MKALFPARALALAFAVLLFQSPQASATSKHSHQACVAHGYSLAQAKAAYARSCALPRVDCDPSGKHSWTCSSEQIGRSSPLARHTAPQACIAYGSSLSKAKVAYARSCSQPRADCDPEGNGNWMCSSEQIGKSKPGNQPIDPDSPIVPGLSVAAQWNELALAGVRDTGARPTVTTWQLFMLSAAMYDALSMYTERQSPYALDERYRKPKYQHTERNRKEAVSQAAYQILSRLYSEYERANGYYRQYLQQLGYKPLSRQGHGAAGVGYAAAHTLLRSRQNDGSNYQNDFAPIVSDRYPQPYVPVNSPDPISNAGIFGPNFNPNRWQPLRVPNGTVLDEDEQAIVDNLNINSFGDQEFLTPHWGGVRPFALADSAQYRPSPPPQFGSDAAYTDAKGTATTNDAAYRSQIEEVLSFSASLDDRRKVIAEFWADGPRTESPPGHWNQLAHGIIERDHMNLPESVRLFFALNGALLDAGIATWEAKRAYDYIRPASAIRWVYQGQSIAAWAGPNKGTMTIPAETWRPYQSLTFVTPPFPEYVSGHSTFSRAAAQVLTHFTGSERFYDGVTTTIQDVNADGIRDLLGEHIAQPGSLLFEDGPQNAVILQWHTFKDAADEAGISRLFGGIHIQDGDLRGRELGRRVGNNAYDLAKQYFHGTINQNAH